jgi:hypothetical protein
MDIPCIRGHPQHGANHWIPGGYPHWSHQSYKLLGDNLLLWRLSPNQVLFQKRHGAPYKVARELPSLTKFPLLWIFESGFIDGLPWDPREWHWQASSQMGGWLSFFWLFRKAGLSKRKETHPERQHLLLHSKVKPAELHHHASYSQNLA